jgi:hypothetical protein
MMMHILQGSNSMEISPFSGWSVNQRFVFGKSLSFFLSVPVMNEVCDEGEMKLNFYEWVL